MTVAVDATILVVDDDGTNRTVLEAVLRRHGYRVVCVDDGSEALAAVAASPPDLILLDVMMPGMSGYEVCDKLRRAPATAAIPVIFITALSGLDDLVQAFDAGGVDYVTKPIRQKEVLARIETHLALHRLRRELEERNALLDAELEEHRRLSEKLHMQQQALAQAMDGIAIADLTGHLRFVNRAWARMHQYTAEDLEGRHLSLCHTAAQMQRDVIPFTEQVIASGAHQGEVGHVRRDGSEFPGYMSTTLLRDVAGEPTGFIGILRDISDAKAAEQVRQDLEAQLRQKQRLASIGALAGGIGHEITNPLTGVINYAQLIVDNAPPETSFHTFASGIIEEAERAVKVIAALRGLAQPGTAACRPVAPVEVVADAAALLRGRFHDDGIALALDLPADLPLVRCRPKQIEHVIISLLTNAAEALNDRFATASPDKWVRVAAVVRRGEDGRCWVRLSIEDNGGGLDAAAREHLFDPFFTTRSRKSNAGLGLSVALAAVRKDGGDLRLGSAPGEPTRFDLDLSAVAAAASGE